MASVAAQTARTKHIAYAERAPIAPDSSARRSVRKSFPHYKQEQDMSCGLASLCMVAHWITGRKQSEAHWEPRTSWHRERGIPPAGMHRALQILCCEESVKVERVPPDRIDPYLTTDGNMVFVLLIDWYVQGVGARVKNLRHWIIVHDVHTPRRNKPVVAVENSLQSSGPDFWPWSSLAPIVGAAFAVTCKPNVR